MFNFNQKLRDRIKDLEREAEYLKKEGDLAIQKNDAKWMVDWKEKFMEIREAVAKKTATIEQLEKRIGEAPYAQLSDILKALVVKLPTLNIQAITVTPKEK